MTNDPDNHAEDGTGRRAEHRAGEASDSLVDGGCLA